MRIFHYAILSALFVWHACMAEEQRSFLDSYLPIFRVIKQTMIDLYRSVSNSREGKQLLRKNNKIPSKVPITKRFPCNVSRSETVPNSAHRVRPGDIDVIGAIGDSLTAGFGVSAFSVLQIFEEERGKSFSIGGQDTWRTVLTLPNILKVFNPNLIGYSLGTSITTEKESQFNVAEGGAVSANMPYMAKMLVRRIKSDPRIDIKKDWKIITHMIGDNDFCSEICYYNNPYDVLSKHRSDLLTVLRIFRNNLPRTIVNVIPPPHLHILLLLVDKPPICYLSHSVSCPCILGLSYENKRKIFFDVMTQWQKLDIEISNLSEFDLDDFTVIPHRFTLNYTFPTTPQGQLDYTVLSQDCFHFSAKGHARFANNLWNSIIEPFGKKSIDGSDTFSPFNCPTEDHPYIFTRRNS